MILVSLMPCYRHSEVEANGKTSCQVNYRLTDLVVLTDTITTTPLGWKFSI